MTTLLDIAVTSLEDAVCAADSGADSLELLRDLPNGGLTPSVALLESVVSNVTIPINVIVRPHARSFHYSADDVAQILRDARQYARAGADSIVFGAVDELGRIDLALVKRVADAAAPVPVTLHRALDQSVDPDAALEALIGVVPRVLTSGPAPTAWEGRETTRRWVEQYGQHFQFVLSGAITMEQLPELAALTRAPVFHLGGAARTNDRVDADKVMRLRSVLH